MVKPAFFLLSESIWRNVLLAICIISLANVAYGQKYTLGFRAGGTLNWAAFRDKEQKDTFDVMLSKGFTVGALIGFPMKNNYSVIIEGGFSQKSRTIKDELLRNKSTYQFVDGSLLLRKSFSVELGKDVPGEYFFNIGPEVSYWLSGKGYFSSVEKGGPKYPYQIKFDRVPDGDLNSLYYNGVNKLFFGIVLGVGLKAPLKNNTFVTTELRFVSGHTNFGQNKYQYPPREWYSAILNFNDTLRMNMKLISLSVAYTYNFDKVESLKGRSTLKKKLKRGR